MKTSACICIIMTKSSSVTSSVVTIHCCSSVGKNEPFSSLSVCKNDPFCLSMSVCENEPFFGGQFVNMNPFAKSVCKSELLWLSVYTNELA